MIIQDTVFTGTPKVKGADNHAHTVAENDTRYINCTFVANGASEGLKASNKTNLTFERCTFVRGVEDGADFVDCVGVRFIGCEFVGDAGPQDITAKGGCYDFIFDTCVGLRRVELGNYTIYDGRGYTHLLQLWPTTPKSSAFCFLNCVLPAPHVVVFWGSRVTSTDVGRVSVFTYWPWVVALFFSVRRLLPETGANKGKV
jgi:hypothetical protein